MQKPELGDKVKDRVTGAEGIVIGYSRWLTGCDTVGIAPRVSKGGSEAQTVWVDVTRVKVLKKGAIKLEVPATAPRNVGGPQPTPRSTGAAMRSHH